MLQDIRDNSQGVIAKVIIGLIVAVFALFGVESIIGGFVTSPPVAEVNGEEITEAQLQFSVQSLLGSIGATADQLDQGLIEQVALNQLIEETVMGQSAEQASLSVSSDRVDRAILETPQFQIGGTFDSDLAVRTMASQGFSVPLYRENLRQRMVQGQLVNAYASSNFVTDAELERVIELTNQTRDFRYLSVTLGTRTLGTAISDEAIAEYYESRQGDFSEDETVVLQYVLLDQDVISEEIAVDESELLARYEEERSNFEGASEKRASHILFEVGANLSQDEALELAAGARQRLESGEDFGVVARELSSDTFSAENDGDIGYTDGSAFPAAVEAALETLELLAVSEPVVSEFGVHLVKLTEDAENVYPPYEEVAERIERELKSSEVELIYAERLEDLSNLAFETGDLDAISQQLDLVVVQSEPISRIGGSGIFANPEVIAAAFSDDVLLESNNSDAIELSDTQALVVRVEEFNEASILPLEEVQAEIAVILRTEMERDAVQALGDQLLAAAEAGEGIDELLLENELEWIEQDGTERNSFSVNREILDRVFGMPAPSDEPELSSITLANGTFALIELNQVNAGNVEDLEDSERSGMLTAMSNDLGNSDFEAYLKTLRSNSDIQASNIADDF